MKNTTKTANVFAFAQDSITANGKTFPAQYSINPAGFVFAFVKVQQGDTSADVRIKIAPDDPNYPAALKAAQQERETRKQEQSAPEASAACVAAVAAAQLDTPTAVTAEAAEEQPAEAATPVADPAPAPAKAQRKAPAKKRAKAAEAKPSEAVTAPAIVAEAAQEAAHEVEPEQPARDPKQTRGPVPEKAFVGTTLKGKGWKILFDGDHARTRVIFTRKPSKAAREAVEKAGFYWSPVMESWTKKLTHKAFRAAQALALELRAVCG